MAKNKQQLSIFDDANVLHNLIENLQALEKKELENPGSLSSEERIFLSGIATLADFKEPPVQPEKLIGKKVSPFSKMMISAAETFSKAKTAFNVWAEEIDNKVQSSVSIVKSFKPENTEKRVSPSILNQFHDKFSSVSMKATGKVGNIADKISFSAGELQKTLERKKLGINERFLEIYDDVTLAKLKAQSSIENKVEATKSSLNVAKGSISAFVEKFEEPWISVSFKGQENIPSLADISYNVGLYAGGAKNRISEALNRFFKKVNPSSEDNVTDTPVAETTAPVAETTAPVVEATAPVAEVAETKIIGSNVKDVPRVDMNELKQKTVNREKPSFMQKLRKFFNNESKSNQLKVNMVGFNIDPTISEKTPEHFLLDDKTGNLPSMQSIFEATEARIKNNIGLEVHQNGGYVFKDKDLDFTNIKKLSTEERVLMGEKLRKEIAPGFVSEVKAASDYLYTLNKNSKSDPILIAFNKLANRLDNDDNLAKNFLIQAKTDPDKAKELMKLNIEDMNVLLKDVTESVFHVEKNAYLLQAATLDLAVIFKSGETIRRNFSLLVSENPEIKSTLDKMDFTQIVPSTDDKNDKNAEKVTVGILAHKMKKRNFTNVLKVPGNEGIVFRDSSEKRQQIIDEETAKQERLLMREEEIKNSSIDAAHEANSSDTINNSQKGAFGLNVGSDLDRAKPKPLVGIAERLDVERQEVMTKVVEASSSLMTYRTGLSTDGYGYVNGIHGIPKPSNYHVVSKPALTASFPHVVGENQESVLVKPAKMPIMRRGQSLEPESKEPEGLNITPPDNALAASKNSEPNTPRVTYKNIK